MLCPFSLYLIKRPCEENGFSNLVTGVMWDSVSCSLYHYLDAQLNLLPRFHELRRFLFFG